MRSNYVKRTLSKGEELVFETKLHWIVFWPFLVMFFFAAESDSAHPNPFVGIFLLIGIFNSITYRRTEFAVTNKRLVAKSGWIRRRTLELNLDKIESISLDQSVLGRLLGYATISVTGTGATKERFKRVAHPFELRAAVMDAMETQRTISYKVSPAS